MSVNGSSGRNSEHDDVVVRKAEHGWVVRGENVPDLTRAMVLADLFAADQAADDDTRLLEAVDENGAPRGPRRAPQSPGRAERVATAIARASRREAWAARAAPAGWMAQRRVRGDGARRSGK